VGFRDFDQRVRSYLEQKVGLPLATFPSTGVQTRESPKRTDEPRNRLLIIRIADGVLATATPRVLAAISPVLRSMTTAELFSPLGVAELGRVITEPGDTNPLVHGFEYGLTEQQDFRPVRSRHTPVPLTRKDVPREQFELRMSERRPPAEADQEDFVWAFACYHDEVDAAETELALFGPRCASIAVVIWDAPDVAGTRIRAGSGIGRHWVRPRARSGLLVWSPCDKRTVSTHRTPTRLWVCLGDDRLRRSRGRRRGAVPTAGLKQTPLP
jgi:hypothetical protein